MAIEEYISLEELPRNWPGLWHEEAQKKGINTIITIFKLKTSNGEIQQIFNLPHDKTDAIGAFIHLFKREEKLDIDIPKNSKIKSPALFESLKIWYSFFKSNKGVKKFIPWKKAPHTLNSEKNTSEFLYKVFSKEETEKVLHYTKANKISLTSLALEVVNNICSKNFINEDGIYRWMMPVNLRGHVKSPSILSNQVAAIGININRNATAKEIQYQTKEKLNSGYFWPVWWSLNIGKYIKRAGVKIIANLFAENSYYMGNISNLGSWYTNNPNTLYCYFAPGRSNFPISFCMLTVNEQLIMTARFHPFIADDIKKEKSVFNEIVENFLKTCN